MQTWTTDTRPDEQQFAYWREVLCEAFVSLEPVLRVDSQPFYGRVESRTLYQTAQASISSRAQANNRRWDEIRRNPVEYYFANFQLAGSCVVRQDGREAIVQPGDFSIVDTTRPYFLDYCENWDVLSFRIPRNQLASRLANPRLATARAVSGQLGAGLVATQFVQSLGKMSGISSIETQESLSTALNSIIAAALGATLESLEVDRAPARDALREAVQTYINDHLTDPELGPDSISARFGVSRRTLYGLFEEADTSICGFIRERRLQQSARELLSAKHGNVLAIAVRWGFNDPSHYSRLFKSRFGVSPRDFMSGKADAALSIALSRLINEQASE